MYIYKIIYIYIYIYIDLGVEQTRVYLVSLSIHKRVQQFFFVCLFLGSFLNSCCCSTAKSKTPPQETVFYPLTGTEHGSQPSLTTRDRELVSVLEVRIEPGDLNPRPLTPQSVTLPTLPRAGQFSQISNNTRAPGLYSTVQNDFVLIATKFSPFLSSTDSLGRLHFCNLRQFSTQEAETKNIQERNYFAFRYARLIMIFKALHLIYIYIICI